MRIVGTMSGTSADAIDVVAIDADLDGEVVRCHVRGHVPMPMPPHVRSALLATLPPATTSAAEVCSLDTALGQAFAAAAVVGINEFCDGAADLVVVSGQTVFHDIVDGRCAGTLQLGQAAWVAERTGVATVADLRTRDVAAGGQGAPLVSLVDELLLAGRPGCAALNLGGIANVTIPGGAGTVAFDTGPANALLDAAVRWRTDHDVDHDGALAAAGRVDEDLLAELLREPFYAAAPPKTTGKELFHLDYLVAALERTSRAGLSTEDLLATLVALTVRTVANALAPYAPDELLVSGGGTRNPVLMAALSAELPGVRLLRPEDLGLPEPAKEAFAFAVIGLLTVSGLPGALPSATGARHARILGSIIPGSAPLVLPPPAGTAPTSLVIT